MSRNIYFEVNENLYHKGKFSIDYKPAFYKYVHYTDGSYRVYEARIFGLTFASYLRMVRDIYGAEIVGRGHLYPMVYFDSKEKAEKLAKDLNKRFLIIISNFLKQQ